MASRLFMLLALAVMIAAAWAALVTLVSTPLTLGWHEFHKAMVRRCVRNVVVPLPIWPNVFSPQQKTVPAEVRAHV